MSAVIPTGSRFDRLKSQVAAEFPPIITGEPQFQPYDPAAPFNPFEPTLPVPENDAQLLYAPLRNSFFRRVERTVFTLNPATGNYDLENKYMAWEQVYRRNIQSNSPDILRNQAANPDGTILLNVSHPTYFTDQPGVFYDGTRYAAYGNGPKYCEISGFVNVEVEVLLQGITGGTPDDYVEVIVEWGKRDGTWTRIKGDGTDVANLTFAMPGGGKRTGSTCYFSTGQIPSNSFYDDGNGLVRISFALVSTAPVSFVAQNFYFNKVSY